LRLGGTNQAQQDESHQRKEWQSARC
jgi:hypothetical protein